MVSNPQKFLTTPARHCGGAIQEPPSEQPALCWAHRVAQTAPVLSLLGLPPKVASLGWENPGSRRSPERGA